MKEFTLSIDMGNAAMSEAGHAADILRDIANTIETYPDNYDVDSTQSIIDVNGNRVGSWKFTP